MTIRTTEEEMQRLWALTGETRDMSKWVLGILFRQKKAVGNQTEYPGWEIEERGRRDLGIKISRDPVPLGMQSPVVLYPEDKDYERFANMD